MQRLPNAQFAFREHALASCRRSHGVSQFAASFFDTRADAATAKRRRCIKICKVEKKITGWKKISNDPSAGSPTETLLRLFLPLSDKVYKIS